MSKTLYLVAHHLPKNKEHKWEFIGIFDTEWAAARECLSNLYFYAPVELGRAIHGATEVFPKIVYPNENEEE